MSGMSLEDKQKILEATLKRIAKNEGKNSVIVYGDSPIEPVPTIPTGSLALDVALGVGGMPRGRIVEAYGPEACGKTTLGLHMVAEAQRAGGLAADIDLEHSLDLAYADTIGVDVSALLMSQPNSGDSGLRIMDELTKSGTVDIIILDSVSSLVPEAELEADITKALPGLQARMMSQTMRVIAGRAARSGTLIYFINQLRHKIGVIFGSPETTSGGMALKFYASVRLDVRRRTPIKLSEDDIIGAQTQVKVVKNKLAPPFKKCTFDIIYGKGIDGVGDLLTLGVDYGIVERSGAWYSYAGERLGQGRENAKELLREHPDISQEIYNRIVRVALPHRFEEEHQDVEQVE